MKILCVLRDFAMKKSYSRTMFLTAREYTVAQALDFRRGKYKYKVRMTAGGGFLGVAGLDCAQPPVHSSCKMASASLGHRGRVAERSRGQVYRNTPDPRAESRAVPEPSRGRSPSEAEGGPRAKPRGG